MTGEMAFSDRGVGGAFNLGYGSGIDLIQISSTPTTNPLDFFPPLTPTTDVETAFEYLSVSCSLDFGELPKRRSLLEDAVSCHNACKIFQFLSFHNSHLIFILKVCGQYKSRFACSPC
jgi:hypothetical protein